MPVNYAEVLKALETEEGRLLTQLSTVRAAKPAIILLMNSQKPEEQIPEFEPGLEPVGRFAGIGATKAIPILLAEKSVPMTTREIMDALKAEGWTTNSTDPVGTVSATLSQLRDSAVTKVGDGWRSLTVSAAAPNSLAASVLYPNASQRPS